MTTRGQLREDALNLADAVLAQRWDATPGGEVDRRLSWVLDREWRRILDAQPYARTGKRTPTTDADGKVALSDLTIGAGDAIERLNRILLVGFGGAVYDDGSQFSRDFFLAQTMGGVNGVGRQWYRDGTHLWVPAAGPNTVADGVWVSHIPARFHTYSSDSIDVPLPEGYDDIFAYEGAAAVLVKGGAETQAAVELKAFAKEMREEFLAHYARLSTLPLRFKFPDSASDWGG